MIRKVKNNKEVTCNICKEVIKVGGYVYDIGRGMAYCHTYCASELLLNPPAFSNVSETVKPCETCKHYNYYDSARLICMTCKHDNKYKKDLKDNYEKA